MDVQVEVTGNGRMSLPTVLQRRWRSSAVLVIDRGSYALLRPVPEDVITALSGAHAGPGMLGVVVLPGGLTAQLADS